MTSSPRASFSRHRPSDWTKFLNDWLLVLLSTRDTKFSSRRSHGDTQAHFSCFTPAHATYASLDEHKPAELFTFCADFPQEFQSWAYEDETNVNGTENMKKNQKLVFVTETENINTTNAIESETSERDLKPSRSLRSLPPATFGPSRVSSRSAKVVARFAPKSFTKSWTFAHPSGFNSIKTGREDPQDFRVSQRFVTDRSAQKDSGSSRRDFVST
jgi:hypothetical protein